MELAEKFADLIRALPDRPTYSRQELLTLPFQNRRRG